jgi:hypothetical protein
MKKLSFYEQVGIVTPGAVFLFGMMFYIPELWVVFAKDGISVGGLGIFVIISYAGGHLLAAFGNVIENMYWRLKGGMPSNWIVGPKPRLLSPTQIAKVEALTASRLGLSLPPLSELTASTWFPIFRQVYSDVERHGKPGRADTFNGNYGLNRGLCAAALALAVAILIQAPAQWLVSLGLVGVSLVYLYRMHRFGVHYAREIYNQFLLLPPESGKPKKAKAIGSNAHERPPSASTS